MTEESKIGATRIAVKTQRGFETGNLVRINPGGATQEDNVIERFGSLIFAQPLRFAHKVGEVVLQLPEAGGPGGSATGVDCIISEWETWTKCLPRFLFNWRRVPGAQTLKGSMLVLGCINTDLHLSTN